MAGIDGPVTTASPSIPVIARLIWKSQAPTITDVPALALAWTRTAVLVRWWMPYTGQEEGRYFEHWIEARTVRRRHDGLDLTQHQLNHRPMPAELDLFYVPPRP